jgi:hypothetical protein
MNDRTEYGQIRSIIYESEEIFWITINNYKNKFLNPKIRYVRSTRYA